LAVIASSNSNIPAGSTSFNPFLGGNRTENSDSSDFVQSVENLQKCSDREARIFFSHRWVFMRKIRDIE
jgi:hypothetical protein